MSLTLALPSLALVTAMAPSQSLMLGVLGSVSAYMVWHQLIVKRAARSTSEWGPRSLANAVSSITFGIGEWWLKFSYNEAEQLESGKVDPKRQYMVVWHPHGVFTINSLFFFTHLSARRAILGKPLFCGVADFLFQVPGLAEFLLLCNAKNVNIKTTEELLASGANVGVNPGGMEEQVNTNHRKESVSFPGRLGFVRLAIKYGVAMLPCYNFGENQLYHTSSRVTKVNRFFKKYLNVGNFLVHGRGGILQTPLLMNPLIFPTPGKNLDCRLGEPVEVGPPDPDPSEEKVQEVFKRYCDGLQKLFDTHKDKCLDPEVAARGLEIDVRPIRSAL